MIEKPRAVLLRQSTLYDLSVSRNLLLKAKIIPTRAGVIFGVQSFLKISDLAKICERFSDTCTLQPINTSWAVFHHVIGDRKQNLVVEIRLAVWKKLCVQIFGQFGSTPTPNFDTYTNLATSHRVYPMIFLKKNCMISYYIINSYDLKIFSPGKASCTGLVMRRNF